MVPSAGQLQRGLGPLQATALNVANMVGIGPFITIPLFIQAMGGPQALVAWVVAAVLVMCDGLVWSELGAALPGSGGTYHFLKEIFGRYRWGRLLPFLFIWQFLISGTLEMASGYIGAVEYLRYMLPTDLAEAANVDLYLHAAAAASALVVTAALCRNIRSIGWLGVALCAGTLVTVLTVIVAGLINFNPQLLTMPKDAFRMDSAFAAGLGAAMLIAVYDYLGYYNVCHLGDEVREPGRTIPRAVLLSVAIVATIYLTMNVSIIAVIPWQEAQESRNIAALFMERLYGRGVAVAFTVLILWTVAACMFAITLGYSRIPFAAARAGDFFRPFARLHPVHGYPVVSLWAMGILTAIFCFFPLESVIKAAVTVRIVIQFIGQIVALHVLRTTRSVLSTEYSVLGTQIVPALPASSAPPVAMPFRMWLYPLPSLLALVGWLFVLGTSGLTYLAAGLGVILSGCLAFVLWTIANKGRSAA